MRSSGCCRARALISASSAAASAEYFRSSRVAREIVGPIQASERVRCVEATSAPPASETDSPAIRRRRSPGSPRAPLRARVSAAHDRTNGHVSNAPQAAARASAGFACTKYCGRPRLPLTAIERHAAPTQMRGDEALALPGRQQDQQHRHPAPPTVQRASTLASLDRKRQQVPDGGAGARVGFARILDVVDDRRVVQIRAAPRRRRKPPRITTTGTAKPAASRRRHASVSRPHSHAARQACGR